MSFKFYLLKNQSKKKVENIVYVFLNKSFPLFRLMNISLKNYQND